MEANPTLFRDLTYIFVAAVLGGVIAWRLRLPLVLGFVLGFAFSNPSRVFLPSSVLVRRNLTLCVSRLIKFRAFLDGDLADQLELEENDLLDNYARGHSIPKMLLASQYLLAIPDQKSTMSMLDVGSGSGSSAELQL